MKREQKQERRLRMERRELIRSAAFKRNLVKDYNHGNIFSREAYATMLKSVDLKVKDIYNVFTQNGYDFVKDTETNDKRYYRLKHIVAECKLAQQLHMNGVIEALNNFGYEIIPTDNRDNIVDYDHVETIPLDYKPYFLDNQHCRVCNAYNILNQKLGIKLLR